VKLRIRTKRGVSREVKVFLLSDVFSYMADASVSPFLSLLVVNKLSPGNISFFGYILAYGLIVRSLFELPLARFTSVLDIKHKKNIVAFGTMFYGILIASLGFSPNILTVFLLQTLLSTTEALMYPLRWSVFTKVIDKGNEEMEWGLEDIVTNIPAALSAVAVGLISQSFGFEITFLLFGLMYVFSGISFYFIKRG